MTLRPSLLPLHMLLLLLLSAAVCGTETGFETESPVRTLQVETLGSLVDGRIIDTSLTRDPLVIELGQKQVIPGLEQSLLDMCVGEKRRAIIPSHLAYGKRGFPPSVPESFPAFKDLSLDPSHMCSWSQHEYHQTVLIILLYPCLRKFNPTFKSCQLDSCWLCCGLPSLFSFRFKPWTKCIESLTLSIPLPLQRMQWCSMTWS
ncbi:peptidyl-prolyl cis-trans isomerase FKBP11 isoform X2 [Callithrix jacchus]